MLPDKTNNKGNKKRKAISNALHFFNQISDQLLLLLFAVVLMKPVRNTEESSSSLSNSSQSSSSLSLLLKSSNSCLQYSFLPSLQPPTSNRLLQTVTSLILQQIKQERPADSNRIQSVFNYLAEDDID